MVTACYSPKKQDCVVTACYSPKKQGCVVTACYSPKKQGYAVTACYPLNSQLIESGLSTISKHSDVMSDITSTDHATVSCGNTHGCLGLHYTTSPRFTLPNKFRMSYLSSFPSQSLPGFWSGPLHCL